MIPLLTALRITVFITIALFHDIDEVTAFVSEAFSFGHTLELN
jgi:hypothetical protein